MPDYKIIPGTELYNSLKQDYQSKLFSIQRLANKYHISTRTITRHAHKGGWDGSKPIEYETRKKIKNQIVAPIVNAVLKEQSKAIERFNVDKDSISVTKTEKEQAEREEVLKHLENIHNLQKSTQKKKELINTITKNFCENNDIAGYITSSAILGISQINSLLLSNKVYYKNQLQERGLQDAQHHRILAETLKCYAEIFGYGSGSGVNININNTNAQQNNVNEENSIIDNIESKVLEVYNNIK